MEIRIQLKKYVLEICLGYHTKWFSQLYFITIAKVWYDENRQIEYGNLIFHSWI